MSLGYAPRALAKMAVDGIAAAVALLAAVLIQAEGAISSEVLEGLPLLLLVVPLGKVAINALIGTYRGMWAYTSLNEALALWVAAGVSSLALLGAAGAGWVAISMPTAVVDALAYVTLVSGIRVLRRVQVTMARRGPSPDGPRAEPERTLFVGADDAADSLIRELEKSRMHNWNIVGLLDDDPAKLGARLHGYPVLGSTSQLEAVILRERVKRVVIAMPSASKSMIRHLITRAQGSGVTVQAVPGIRRLLRYGSPVTTANVTLNDLVASREVKALIDSRATNGERQRVLVTGGAGYIGSHVVRMLLDSGSKVRVLDNFTYGRGGLEPVRHHPNLEVMEGDISSIRDMVSAVRDVDSVIALAAIVGDPACGLNAEETLTLNYESTKILTEVCNFYGVSRLVFASSCSVYGASDDALLHEQSALNPVSLYARTRILSEEIIFERAGDVVPVILRLATVYGLSPRMRYDLVVNALTVQAAVQGNIRIFGGNQWRPFVHCTDAARAFIAAAKAPADLVRFETFNVGGVNCRIADVGRMVADQIPGIDVQAVDEIDDPRNYRVSFDKIRDTLDFHPTHHPQSGITEMVEAIRARDELRNFEDPAYSNVKWLKGRMEEKRLLYAS